MTRVLLVEDEQSYSDPLSFMLRQQGYDVDLVEDGKLALDAFARQGADLILLDLMLPGMSGLEVCKEIRKSSNVPIIIVTAKNAEVDKVVGLELGADDYVTKPFSTRELVARIRAILRGRGALGDEGSAALVAGPVSIDVDRHVVEIRGEETPLPLKEFELLELLVRNAGRVLTRDQILERVWGEAYHGDGKTLDVHIKRLRAKIETDRERPRHLMTVRGLGYRFDV